MSDRWVSTVPVLIIHDNKKENTQLNNKMDAVTSPIAVDILKSFLFLGFFFYSSKSNMKNKLLAPEFLLSHDFMSSAYSTRSCLLHLSPKPLSFASPKCPPLPPTSHRRL